jgi:hypothetical protein
VFLAAYLRAVKMRVDYLLISGLLENGGELEVEVGS